MTRVEHIGGATLYLGDAYEIFTPEQLRYSLNLYGGRFYVAFLGKGPLKRVYKI